MYRKRLSVIYALKQSLVWIGRRNRRWGVMLPPPWGLRICLNTWNSSASCSVAQLCPTVCDPMDCSTPGFPVRHQLLEPTQTHVHRVGDAIHPFNPLLSPSPPTFNLSQYQGLFKWVSSLHQVAKVLEFHLQHQSFQFSGLISFRIDWFDLPAVQGSLKSLLQHYASKASILWQPWS